MFKHKTDLNIPEIKAKTTDGVRLYETPEGKFYPSITTVLKNRDKQGLFEWRQKVGEDVANYVARTAATRGTQVHHFCEKYLNNLEDTDDWNEYKKGRFLSHCLLSQLKPYLNKSIGLVHCQEQALWHNYYKVAGRVDCIAEWNGELSIIDFKTSRKLREDDWNENYYIQASAYAEMYQERTLQEIEQIVILVVTEDGTVQEFVKKKHPYLHLLDKELNMYYNDNKVKINQGNFYPGLLPTFD